MPLLTTQTEALRGDADSIRKDRGLFVGIVLGSVFAALLAGALAIGTVCYCRGALRAPQLRGSFEVRAGVAYQGRAEHAATALAPALRRSGLVALPKRAPGGLHACSVCTDVKDPSGETALKPQALPPPDAKSQQLPQPPASGKLRRNSVTAKQRRQWSQTIRSTEPRVRSAANDAKPGRAAMAVGPSSASLHHSALVSFPASRSPATAARDGPMATSWFYGELANLEDMREHPGRSNQRRPPLPSRADLVRI